MEEGEQGAISFWVRGVPRNREECVEWRSCKSNVMVQRHHFTFYFMETVFRLNNHTFRHLDVYGIGVSGIGNGGMVSLLLLTLMKSFNHKIHNNCLSKMIFLRIF